MAERIRERFLTHIYNPSRSFLVRTPKAAVSWSISVSIIPSRIRHFLAEHHDDIVHRYNSREMPPLEEI